MEPKGCHSEPRDDPKQPIGEQGRASEEKGCTVFIFRLPCLIQDRSKYNSTNHKETIASKHGMSCQRGAKMEPKVMLQLVPYKIMNYM